MRATITRGFELDSDNPEFAYQIPGTHHSPTITALTNLAEARKLAASGPDGAITAMCRAIAAATDYEALIGQSFEHRV